MVDKNKQALDIVNVVVGKINSCAELNEGWGKTLQLWFTDMNVGYCINVAMEGNVKNVEKVSAKQKKEVTFSMPVQTFVDIVNKVTSSKEAMNSGKLEVDGAVPDLIKVGQFFS
jgi:putative sterol carrier protein